jgi:hypothetical protein
MHQKLDLLEERRSAGVGLSDKKPAAHSAWAAAQLDKLPAARDVGQWKSRTLRLKVRTLHWELETLVLKLWAWDLHRCTAQK